MSTPTSPTTPPAGDDRNLVQAAPAPASPGFEERLQAFWSKHAKLIMLVCVVVLAAIVARGAMEWMAANKEKGIAADYAAATTNDQLRSFIAAHPSHALAGAAHLRLADEAFAAGNQTAALGDYQKAAEILKTGPFAGRARLGAAMSKHLSGDLSGAQADLRAIADDITQLKAVRAEAAYHLASLASEAGNSAEVARLADQVMAIDPTSLWSQRAMMLRVTAPSPAAAAPAESAAPAAGDALPSIQFKTGN